MTYGTFTLTGRHTTPSGKAHAGSVVVTPNCVIRDVAGDVVMSGAEQVKLDETGAWSVVLPCDSAGLNPSEGIGYSLGYSLYSTAMNRQSFYATADLAGRTLDVSEIVTVPVPAPLSAIVGPKGDPGSAGADGAPGPKGDPGQGVDPDPLAGWFAGGIRGKKIVLVGDSTTEFAYGLNRALMNYTRPGQPLDGVGILNYGWSGQTVVGWDAAVGRYGKAGTIATGADLFVFSYGINDIRLGGMSEDMLVAKVAQAVSDLRAGVPGCTVLLRMPAPFTAADTGGLGQISPQSPTAAQTYSDLMRNAYRRAAAATACPLLDTQALVYGKTSVADTKTTLMLNQIHPNDAGNLLVARELVRMIGSPASSEPVAFSLRGRAGNVVLGRRVLSAGGRVAVGSVRYRPTAMSGSLTVEVRKVAVGGALTVLGTIAYTGGFTTSNVMTPAAALTDWTTLAAGEGVEVAITASTAPVSDVEVPVYIDEQPPARAYPLELRRDGLTTPSGVVSYPATTALAAGSQRSVRSLTSVLFQAGVTLEILGTSPGDYNDLTRPGWQKVVVTLTGNPGAQTVTATNASAAVLHSLATTPGQQYTFAWKANPAAWATPKFTIYNPSGSSFIVADNTPWPAPDGDGWYKVTFTAASATTNCYMARGMSSGSSFVFNVAKAVSGTDLTATPLSELAQPASAFGDDLTLLHLVRLDAVTSGVTADIVSGPALIQVASGGQIGAQSAGARGTAARGQDGAWQVIGVRQTKAGGTVVVAVNDQGPSAPLASVAGSAMKWNPTGQNWSGEVITFYWPYLLTDGELMAFTRSALRTLAAAGEAITVDWPSQRYL